MSGRRRFLRALAAATGVAVAGCSGGSGDGTSTDGGAGPEPDSEGTTTTPGSAATTARSGTAAAGTDTGVPFPELGADDPTYRNWLPAEGDARLAGWAARNLSRVRARRDRLPAEAYESAMGLVAAGDYFGVDVAELSGFVNALSGPGTVYPGSFDRSTVDATLTDSGYEQFDTRGNVAFYRETDAAEPERFAVGDAGVIDDVYGTPERFRERAVVLFETAAGDRQRLHEADERFRRYSDAVGWPLGATQLVPAGSRIQFGSGVQLPEAVRRNAAVGQTEHVVDGATVSRLWLWTTADGDLSPAAARSQVESGAGGDLPTDVDLAVRRDGRVVEAAVIRPVESAGGGVDPPRVTLDETVADGALTLANRAGDTLSLDRVTVRVGSDTYAVEGSLAAGDATTVGGVPTDTGGTIRVIYESPSGGSSVTLATVEPA
jgi:hypothetical protein